MSSALTQQRCFHHLTREAAALCLECRRFYCRECVTEHAGRVVCASCLKIRSAAPAKGKQGLGRWLFPVAGFAFTWGCFYLLGRLLASIPPEVWGGS